jgi:hypothetical protein
MLFLGTYTYARWTGYWNTDLPSRVYFELIPHADSSLRRQRKTKMLKIDEKNKTEADTREAMLQRALLAYILADGCETKNDAGGAKVPKLLNVEYLI